MDTLVDHGTEWKGLVCILGTVCTHRRHFRPGIGHTWLCLRLEAPIDLVEVIPNGFPQQIIWTYAQEIAEMYSDSQRAEYRSAAASLRIPYWDWATSPGLPAVAIEPSILVNTPEGRRTIRNPLYSYRFQSDAAGNGFPQGHPVRLSSANRDRG